MRAAIKDSKGLEQIKKNLARKSALISQFMESTAGQELIRVLEEEFYDGELVGKDPHQTYYNLGRRDVVSYLKQLAVWREPTKESDFL